MHALPTKTIKPNQVRQRVMIFGQNELDINQQVQKWVELTELVKF